MLTSVETGCTPRRKHVDGPSESIRVLAIGGSCQPPDPLTQQSNRQRCPTMSHSMSFASHLPAYLTPHIVLGPQTIYAIVYDHTAKFSLH